LLTADAFPSNRLIPGTTTMLELIRRIGFDCLSQTWQQIGRSSWLLRLMLLAVVLVCRTFGQGGPMVVGSGYGLPNYLTVAPGQVMTLQVTGLKAVLPSPLKSTASPLPTVLSGISVSLTQYIPKTVSFAVPLIAISQRSFCSDPSSASPDCRITFITLQIPFELTFFQNPLAVDWPLCPSADGHCPKTELQVSENGTVSRAFAVMPVGDNIHIITDCDLKAFGSVEFAIPFEFSIGGGTYPTCQSIATHADGTPISHNAPAMASEIVVLYAWGIGPTQPLVKTGELTPAPASPTWANDVQFNFSPNTSPSKPYAGIFPFAFEFHPRFIGLVQNEIGLYQINVKLPDTFPKVQPCDAARDLRNYPIQSNLTITVGGINSFDGAAICIQPPQ
jgi:uncharacterized protein (TIGR03437 family)